MGDYLTPGVYLKEVEPGSRPIEGVGTAVAAFVGMAATGPKNKPTLVTNWSQFRRTFGDFVDGSYLAHAVFGFFNNGGTVCYVLRIGGSGEEATLPQAELPSATDPSTTTYRITSRDGGGTEADITIDVGDATESAPEDSFRMTIRRGSQSEPFDNLTTRQAQNNAVTVVNAQSKLIEIEEVGRAAIAKRRPANGSYTLARAALAAPDQIDAEDYVGDVQTRSGFGALELIDEITMVCVPDLMAAYARQAIDLDAVQFVQQAMIDHCERMQDRMAILDAPFENARSNAQDVLEWRSEKAKYDSPYAALYWPWVKVFNPLSSKDPRQPQEIAVPPSGHVAGIWSRTDQERGVHKAPANEVVRGAVDLATQVTAAEQGLLNPEGVNVIRSFPGQGIRVWGARTLASTKTEWRYVNVRRLFNYLEESILEATQWVVFEPNDRDLWQRISRTVKAFLTREWRNGALFGSKPEEAFYVKCDDETNPAEVIEAGQVVIEIGVAPVKPAEFVIFQVQQLPSGSQVSE